MSAEQDKLLNAIQDEGTARVLAEIWKQIEGEPLAAARMIRAFQGAKAIITDTLKELPEKWEKLEVELTKADLHRAQFTQDLRDFRANTSRELADAMVDLQKVSEFFDGIDEDKFLNKANRILDLCDRLAKAKRDGTLDWIKSLKP